MLTLTRPENFPWTRRHPDREGWIRNEHSLVMIGDWSLAAELLALVGSPQDRIWPRDRFPAMELDAGHALGSSGGHGSVRYRVAEASDSLVCFELHPGTGLIGEHVLWFERCADSRLRWAHRLDLEVTLSPSALRLILALHDAIIEQLLLNAEAILGGYEPVTRRLSPWLGTIRPVYVALEKVISRRRKSARARRHDVRGGEEPDRS